MQTPEGFRSLASLLRGEIEAAPSCVQAADVLCVETPPHDASEREEHEAAMLREVRLFNARIAERLDETVETLAADIAAEVLARELQLAPADVECIVDRALQRYAAEEPLRVRVSASDVHEVSCPLPVIADETLRAGDAVVELRDGAIDARLGVRLAAVLEALQ